MKEKIKFRPIGEEFQLNEVTLKVVQANGCSCSGCFFKAANLFGCLRVAGHGAGECHKFLRSDEKYVIFKNVTTNGHND